MGVGHRAGKGNPFGGSREKWRAAVHKGTTPEQFKRILDKTLHLAEEGTEWAVKEIFDRLMGKATQTLEVDARVNVQQVWEASADDLIALARQAGMVDQLPPRLRALAELPQPEVIDVTAREVPFSENAQTVEGAFRSDSPTLPAAE